ncbi:MAG TPA: TIGR02594 family protein [Dongiaceae bacterium]|nr:TIGR02594 family protein [Dongiaceae bacterium]
MKRTLRIGDKGPEVKALQELLNSRLLLKPPLHADGDFGPRTDAAVKRFQAQYHLGVDGVVGPKTWQALESPGAVKKPIVTPVVVPADCSWMKIAQREIGEREIAGSQHNPQILRYHASTSLKATTDETAWCSSFVNWVLKEAKITGTNSAAAASWISWGAQTSAKSGAITVIRNAAAANSSLTVSGNHVGFLVKETATHYLLLGGNQSNQVKVSSFPKKSWALRGFRWPAAK